jgi:hypothetical protein
MPFDASDDGWAFNSAFAFLSMVFLLAVALDLIDRDCKRTR